MSLSLSSLVVVQFGLCKVAFAQVRLDAGGIHGASVMAGGLLSSP